jgi:hypothetical protein
MELHNSNEFICKLPTTLYTYASHQNWHNADLLMLHMHTTKTDMWCDDFSYACHQNSYNVVWWCLIYIPLKLIQCGLAMSHIHAIKSDIMRFGDVSHACHQKWYNAVWWSHTHATKTDIMWFADVSHACHQNQCMWLGAKLIHMIWWCLGTNQHLQYPFRFYTWHKNTYCIYLSARQSRSLNFVLK